MAEACTIRLEGEAAGDSLNQGEPPMAWRAPMRDLLIHECNPLKRGGRIFMREGKIRSTKGGYLRDLYYFVIA